MSDAVLDAVDRLQRSCGVGELTEAGRVVGGDLGERRGGLAQKGREQEARVQPVHARLDRQRQPRRRPARQRVVQPPQKEWPQSAGHGVSGASSKQTAQRFSSSSLGSHSAAAAHAAAAASALACAARAACFAFGTA